MVLDSKTALSQLMTSPSSAQSTSQQLVTQVPKGTGIEKKTKKKLCVLKILFKNSLLYPFKHDDDSTLKSYPHLSDKGSLQELNFVLFVLLFFAIYPSCDTTTKILKLLLLKLCHIIKGSISVMLKLNLTKYTCHPPKFYHCSL